MNNNMCVVTQTENIIENRYIYYKRESNESYIYILAFIILGILKLNYQKYFNLKKYYKKYKKFIKNCLY